MWFRWHDGLWGLAAGGILGVALLALVLRGWGWRSKSWRWWAAGWVLPLLAAMMVCLAIAGVEAVERRQAPVAILLDLSPSTRGSPWRDPAFVRKLAEKRLGGGRHITVEGFGVAGSSPERVLLENVSPEDAGAWPGQWPAEVVEALAHPALNGVDQGPSAEPSRGTAAPAARWILTDGLLPPNTVARLEGTADAWTLVPPSSTDVAVRDLKISAIGGGVEVLAQVRVVGPASSGAPRVHLTVSRDGQEIASQELAFHAAEAGAALDSSRWVSVQDALIESDRRQPHRYDIVARLLSADGKAGDPWPENDGGEIIWPGETGSAPRVLVVGSGSPAAISDAGEFVSTGRFFGDVRRWTAEGWQAIVLDDVPGEEIDGRSPLSEDAARALRQFVEETGGGLILLGNGHAFGPGAYGETGEGSAGDILEQLSPVSSHFHGAPRQVVYLLDASASMNEAAGGSNPGAVGAALGGSVRKFTLLSRAVAQSAAWLAPEDQLTLIGFNKQAHMLYTGSAGAGQGRAAMLAGALDAVSPAGPTVPDTALSAAGQTLLGGQSSDRLVILVTDGEIPAMDVDAWSHLLQQTKADLCIVAPPAAGDSPLMRLSRALGPRAHWLPAGDPGQWSPLLSRELAAHVRGAQQQSPVRYPLPPGDDPAAGSGTAKAWTQVWRKAESEVVLRGWVDARGPEGPVLSAWAQRGLGRVGALVIAQDGSADYAAVYASLLRQVAAAAGDRRFQLAATHAGDGQWIITADGADPTPGIADRFIDGESLTARIFIGDSTFDVPMPQTGPGHYEARIAAAGGFSAIVSRNKSDEGAQLVGRLNTADVQTAEWPASVPPPRAPRGLLLPWALEDAPVWNPTFEVGYSLVVPLLVAALVAALAALFLRRKG